MEARAATVATLWFAALAVFILIRLLTPQPEFLYSRPVLEVPAAVEVIAQPVEHAPQPRVYGMMSGSPAPVARATTGAKPAAPAPKAEPAAEPRVGAAEPAKSEPAFPAQPPAMGRARDQWDWAYLWKRPAEYIVRHTWLRSSDALTRRLSDPDSINRYLDRPLVRATLESPTFVRLLAGNHALVGAFLESPAMQDPKTVKELFTSPLVQRILASRGVQEFTHDPAAMAQALDNPALVTWFRTNPSAEALFTLAGNAGQTPRRKG